MTTISPVGSATAHGARPGFHEGELTVQRAAGVVTQASRLSGMLDAPDLRGAAGFLAAQRFAVLSARDSDGRLWTSPLAGPEGFLRVIDARTLRVEGRPRSGDPLAGLGVGEPVGMLAIDLERRRRVRVNGRVIAADPGGLRVEVDQAYGNCPQFIQQRVLRPASVEPAEGAHHMTTVGTALTDGDVELIRAADTFFLGTSHPDRGGDASHRGGPPGFVRVEDATHLWWPDYAGNNMFNSFGNLAVDPTAALLFSDFSSGRTLHLSGRATLEVAEPGGAGDDGHTGRRVRFTVDLVRVGPPLAVRSGITHPCARHPAVTD